ncbi:MAG: hypothetical protein JRH06_00510 [Deltaproteobacteria bacterium]|nr:hypothetical protein [Deltaproteobacteria bacterium]MBW2136022.1 hypothetical protein [Deltaproteobacteria bacterium]
MKTQANRIEWENVRIVPILHNRMEFALEVRRQFLEFKPTHVAVEYPSTLKEKTVKGIERLPLLSVVYYEEKDGTFVYLLLEPTDGQVEALRLALEDNLCIHFIDRDTEGYPLDLSPMPDPYSVTRIGHFFYCQAYLQTHRDSPRSVEDRLREKTMAYHLQKLNESGERVLFVCGLYHLPGILDMLGRPQTEVIGRRIREGVGLAHLHRESSAEVMTEMPFLAASYEKSRKHGVHSPLDRMAINRELIGIARERHQRNNREELSRNQVRVLHKYSRNYALLTGNLVPSFYQLVIAARGAVDDNFAYELWEKGSDYPWQTEDPGLPILRLKGEDLFLDQRRIRFHRRLKTFRRRLVPVPVKKRPREKVPGEWRRQFDGLYICSYPPEDVVIEGYGRYLQKRALEIRAEENSRTVPFVSSMMDGIDIRQTIREWHQGKIFVKENMPIRGKVGSVVVIFDPDVPKKDEKEVFPWRVTWLGEHEQESDMAFYGTPAGEIMDGPGISRCQYGGFMLTYPPMRVYDIWKDPFFDAARNKPERLLMAALDYSLEKHVVYVAADPPSGWCRSMAAKLGKKIIYLPIGIFSPVTLKKIREFHVLEGHHVRRYAKHFI